MSQKKLISQIEEELAKIKNDCEGNEEVEKLINENTLLITNINQIQNDIEEYDEVINAKKNENNDICQKIDNIKALLNNLENLEKFKNKLKKEYIFAKGNMRVYCRIRPKLQKEKENEIIKFEIINDFSVRFTGVKNNKNVSYQYFMDKIFSQDKTQIEIFNEFSDILENTLEEGGALNLFAYGRSGAGKTYTIQGNMNNPNDFGIAPRAITFIFDRYNKTEFNLNVFISIIQIYNNRPYDLLNESSNKDFLEHKINNLDEFIKLYINAIKKRVTAQTSNNEKSSRSHLILKIRFELKNRLDNIKGTINLIDLAGNENFETNINRKETQMESKEINRSLSFLKNVLIDIKNNKKNISLRDAKLTEVLKQYLNKDSITVILFNISPLISLIDQTINTFNFCEEVFEANNGKKK